MNPAVFPEALQAALGRQYQIERELGRGGMGVVYLAKDLTLERLVAVKVVHPDLSTNKVVSARFLTEARTIAKIRHPNIVSVHSAGEVDGQLYYVMDYLPGETLRQRLARDPRLAPDTAIRIGSDIADALDAASQAGVIHRDLKPENILLEGSPTEPRALLADFGIARLVEGGDGHTGPGTVMGTPAYMSPEQAAGEELDGRSDLYSLGIVCYEMLAGAPPFVGPHRAVISKQILDPPTPLNTIRPDLPPGLAQAVMRALEKTPDERWSTGKRFRQALTGEGTTPTPAAAVATPRSFRRVAPWLAVIAALLALGFSLFRDADGPPAGVDRRRSILVLPFENLRQAKPFAWLRTGSVNMLSLALSQWRDLTVVDQARVQDLLDNARIADSGTIGLEAARRLAREGRVWTVILGDFSLVDDSIHLVARPYDVASGESLDVVRVDGLATADVRPLFDELAAKLLDLTGAPKTNWASLTSVTTESLQAYHAYLRGVDALNHWRLTEASDELKASVRLDSTFSLANYKLAIARGWISPVDTTGLAAIRRASRTSGRLPNRDRQLVEAYQTFVSGDYLRGMAIYGQLVRQDSSDVEAWFGVADAAFHAGYTLRPSVGLLSQSLKGFRRLIGLDSTYGLAYEHIGALLNDASGSNGWLRLVGEDSLALAHDKTTVDSSLLQQDRHRAIGQAIGLAQTWTRLQPNTARAHYHLYKAFLSGGRTAEAQQTLSQLKSLFPDSVQAFFGLLEARVQFVANDIRGSAETIRKVLPRVRPHVFGELDFAPEPLLDAMTGIGALGYFGDLQGATALIRLGRELRRQRPEDRDSSQKARDDDLWELSRLATLYSAVGTRTDRLRAVWNRGLELVKASRPEKRAADLAMIAPAAIGLLIGPTGDSSAVDELDRLTEKVTPAVFRALMAARAGDSGAARSLLASGRGSSGASWDWDGDVRPIVAETYFELGDYQKVITALRDFQPTGFSTRGFDPRWILLPRVRLLRGQALERTGQNAPASVEYRAVITQWVGADAELLSVVQQARHRLAAVTGALEGR